MSYKFDIGEHVAVRSNKYKEVPTGTIGVVFRYYKTQVCVQFLDISNPRSMYDCFYFKQSELVHYKETKHQVKESNIMEGNYRIAQVRFLEGNNTDKTYPYACYDLSMTAGDICVVKSAHHGLGIAQIVEIGQKTDQEITREIICKCDFSDYNKREAVRKRKAELVRLMHSRADELREIALFKALAANDQDMATMLKEYSELEGAM